MKAAKLQPWALRAALEIYREVENGITLEQDMKRIIAGGWARVIQRAHDEHSVTSQIVHKHARKRDSKPFRTQPG